MHYVVGGIEKVTKSSQIMQTLSSPDSSEPFDEFGRVRLQVGYDVGDIPNNGGVDRHANNDPQKDVGSFGACYGHHIANDYHHQRRQGPVEGTDVQLHKSPPPLVAGSLPV